MVKTECQVKPLCPTAHHCSVQWWVINRQFVCSLSLPQNLPSPTCKVSPSLWWIVEYNQCQYFWSAEGDALRYPELTNITTALFGCFFLFLAFRNIKSQFVFKKVHQAITFWKVIIETQKKLFIKIGHELWNLIWQTPCSGKIKIDLSKFVYTFPLFSCKSISS